MCFGNAFVTAFTCTVLHYIRIMNFIKDYFDNFISTSDYVKARLYFDLDFPAVCYQKFVF